MQTKQRKLKRSKIILDMSRAQLRLATGHNTLNSHLERFRILYKTCRSSEKYIEEF